MRFISRSQAFKKSVIKAQQTIIKGSDGAPQYVTTREPYIAFFQQGGATPYDVKLALERFQFKGLSERENPARRISIYDTDERAYLEGWAPEFKAEVEAALVKGQNTDYFLVEQPKAALPWPSYATTDPSQIVDTAAMIGVSLGDVLQYERENANRPKVIKAIEGATESVEVEISA